MTTVFTEGGELTTNDLLDALTLPAARAQGIQRYLQGYTAWIQLPEAPTEPTSRLPRLLNEARSVTGWSQREIADILGTSHTTIRRLETDGRVTIKSRDVAARAAQLHAVLIRLARIAGSPETLATALATTVDGTTAAVLLREANWSHAFTTALDAVRGPRPGFLGTPPGSIPADATRELRP